MPLRKQLRKLIKNTGIFAIGSLGSKVIVYILTPIYTTYLSTSEYGYADIYYTTIQILIPIITLRISSAMFRFSIEKEYDRKSLISNAAFVCLGASVMVFLIYSMMGRPLDLKLNPFLFSGCVLVISLDEVFGQFSKSIDKNYVYAINSILLSATLLLSNYYLLAIKRMGIDGYFLSMLVANIISIGFLFVCARIYCFIGIKNINKEILMKMLSYSIPLVPAAISFWIIQASDRYMVLYMIGSSAAGLYSVAYKIPNICGAFVNIFSQAWEISAIQNYTDKEFLNYIFKRYYFMVIAFSGILLIFSRPIATFLFKSDFLKAYDYVLPLIVAFVFSYLQTFFEGIYVALKETKKLMNSVLIGALVNVVLNFLLIPIFNVYGAIIATGVSYIIIFATRYQFAVKMNILSLKFLTNLWMIVLLAGEAIGCFYHMYIISFVLFAILMLLIIREARRSIQ